MKNTMLMTAAICIIAAAFTACKDNCDDTFATPSTIELCHGETALWNKSGDVSITFKEVAYDGRCPDGAACIVADNFGAILELKSEDVIVTDTIGIPTEIPVKMTDELTWDGFKVKFLEVKPDMPASGGIKTSKYRIKLEVSQE